MRPRLSLIALALLAAVSPAAAIDLPARKVGLWETRTSFEGGSPPPNVMQQCIDAETDQLVNSFGDGLSQTTCKRQGLKQVGNTLVVDSVCQFGPITTALRAVITGDFNSAYSVKVTSRQTGGPAMGRSADANVTLNATWLGACKAGQQPGDIILAGRRFNIRDLQRRMPGGAGAPPVQK